MPLHLVCAPAGAGNPSVAPCGDVGGVPHVPVMLDLPAPGAVHFENAQLLFAYGFGGVLTIWVVGLVIGAVLSLISRSTE